MELPARPRGDELLPPGEMTAIRERLRSVAHRHDLTSVITYAFDHGTRILPFIYADMKIAPAGVRAIGSAMVDSGFPKTRIVLQQWNQNFRPSEMRLDDRVPDLFMVSSLRLHSGPCQAMIRDACRIDPWHRPLIVAGGPLAMYEPWEVFSSDPRDPWGADVAVTGEEFVLLELLEVLCSLRGANESMRSAFLRARDTGALDDVPGLVYAQTDRRGVAEELVDTGVQRLLGDFDELPFPVLGYGLLEPPSRRSTLGREPLAPDQVRKYGRIGSLLLTQGCKFRCPYCPIPSYNQRQFRAKSGERISEEIDQLYQHYRIRMFYGADDNFFNNKERALDIAEAIGRKVDAASGPHCKVRWGTEATVHDTLKMKEHLPALRKAGLWALWLGVEDMTATLVKKGQTGDKTTEAFRLLRENGIFPIPMMMHHDSQPLVSFKSNYGLINQLGRLRRAGAVFAQVLMLVPAAGSKLNEETYTSGMTYESVNGVPVEPRIMDGNYVVASRHPRPWLKQLNLLLAYLYFFNPWRLLVALVLPKTRIPHAADDSSVAPGARDVRPLHRRIVRRVSCQLRVHLADAVVQLFGMWALAHTARRTLAWCWHLLRGKIKRTTAPPASQIPMRNPEGGPASHALPGTPVPELEHVPELAGVAACTAHDKGAQSPAAKELHELQDYSDRPARPK
jgi:radical SAM superfamily enzyme YgiQ (UPF0313 family)